MKRISIIVCCAACILLLSAVSAMAFGEIRYPDRPLNLRDGRTPSSNWVGALSPGQKVRVAFLKDGWVAVFEPGETREDEAHAAGYSNLKYLKKKQLRVEPKPWGRKLVASRDLNVRQKPYKESKQVGMLKSGTRVIVDFPDDEWALVFPADATIRSKINGMGYANTKYMESANGSVVAGKVETKVAPAPKPAAKPAPKPVPVAKPAPKVDPIPKIKPGGSTWGKVVTIPRRINLRAKRTTNSTYIRTLIPGEVVRVDYLKNGWYAVFRENETLRRETRAMGYVLKSLLDSKPVKEKKSMNLEPAASRYAPKKIDKPKSASVPAPAVTDADPAMNTASMSTLGGKKATTGGTKKTMVIDKSRFKQTKRPDPIPDKTAHGYQYRLLEKTENKRYGESWITMKVFLSTTKLPGTTALEDFATTLWRKNKRTGKNLAVLIYLPGMDTEDLSYAVVQFSDEKLLEFWARKTTLFGTKFQ